MTFLDRAGGRVRLTPERLAHIREHPEMIGLERDLVEALREPRVVVQSLTDPSAILHYRFCRETLVGDKWLCVVVKYTELDAFVLTAYLTDRIKKGRPL